MIHIYIFKFVLILVLIFDNFPKSNNRKGMFEEFMIRIAIGNTFCLSTIVLIFVTLFCYILKKSRFMQNKIDETHDDNEDINEEDEEEEENSTKKKQTIKQKQNSEDKILKHLSEEIEKRDDKKVTCLAIVCNELIYYNIHRLIEKFTRCEIENDVYIIVHIPSGGDVSDCAIVSNILLKKFRENPEFKVTMFVPEIALSSGTQIALHSTELVMGKYAHLGPIDDQLRGLGVKHIKTIMKQPKCKKQNFTLKEYDVIQQSNYMYDITRQELKTILKLQNYTKKEIKNIRKLFLDHDKYHSYPITIEKAREHGLKVTELDDELILNAFYDIYDIWVNLDEDISESE